MLNRYLIPSPFWPVGRSRDRNQSVLVCIHVTNPRPEHAKVGWGFQPSQAKLKTKDQHGSRRYRLSVHDMFELYV